MFRPEDRRDISLMCMLTGLFLAAGVIFYTAGLVTEAAGGDPDLFGLLSMGSSGFSLVTTGLGLARIGAIYFRL